MDRRVTQSKRVTSPTWGPPAPPPPCKQALTLILITAHFSSDLVEVRKLQSLYLYLVKCV